MDFTNRAGRPAQPNQQVVSPSTAGGGSHQGDGGAGGKKKDKMSFPFNNIATTLLLVSAAIVVLGLTWLLIFSRDQNEREYVDHNELQAVFLNGGQVYFGKITTVNDRYMRLNNIYYLRVEQQVQPETEGQSVPQQISLAKLGCELHGPEDEMVINKEQVLFWENLKNDGDVAKAVKQYVEANPGGKPDCEAQKQQQQDSTGSSNSNGGATDDTTTNGTDGTTDTPPATAPEEETTN